MSDTPKFPRRMAPPSQSLSEISHLFLSELRQRQTGGAPQPTRKPPAASIDLTPEEFAHGLQLHPGDSAAEEEQAPRPNISLLIGHHLTSQALPCARRYAAHLAKAQGRVGLIELGDDGLRLSCFDNAVSTAEESPSMEPADGKRISQAIDELSWDIERWLILLLAPPKSDAARKIAADLGQWTLLTTASDEGVVGAYRALKGLAPLGNANVSLAILDAEDDEQATIVHRKLSGAGKHFLDRPVESAGRVKQADGVAEHVVLFCRADSASQDHWTAISDFAAQSAPPQEPAEEKGAYEPIPLNPTIMTPKPEITAAESFPIAESEQVLDIPAAADASAILSAICSRQSEYQTSSVIPPMCPQSKVAVDRQGRLVLLSIAEGGMTALQSIGQAYRWLNENRALIRMALPQMKIDAAAMPKLALYAEPRCSTGLSAIFQGNLTVHTFRRLKWGEKSGLLLEAA